MKAAIQYAMQMKDLMTGPLGKIAGSFQHVMNTAGNAQRATSAFARAGQAAFNALNIVGVVSKLTGKLRQFTEANQNQQEAETKLAQVMRNTMDASDSEIQSIKDLTAAQQRLGVIGDEVQLAGAQELGTYLQTADSLKQLIPVMNDMVAQQYGLNASQENAVGIATMMGKVMDGQVGALSRYGYKFSEAQEKILKYGTEAQRVATLTEVITESVGGMNEALAKTSEGRMKQLSNTLGDLKERVGQEITKIGVALLPAVESIMPVVEKVMDKASRGVDWLVKQIGSIKPYLEAMARPFVKMFNTVRERIQGMTQAFEPVRTALQGMGQTLMGLINRIGESFGGLLDYLQPVVDVFTEHLLPLFQTLYDAIAGIVGDIIEFVSQSEILKDIFSFVAWVVGKIGDILKALVSVLKWMWDHVVKPILNGIDKAWSVVRKVNPLSWFRKSDKSSASAATPEQIGGQPSVPVLTDDEVQHKLTEIAKNTRSNRQAVQDTQKAVASSGPKVVNISIGKFFDSLHFNTTNLQESANKIEETVLEVLSRVLVQGAASI